VDSGELTNTGTSTAAQLGLATAGTAGTYTKVTTDTFGRVTTGTTLILGDLPSGVALTGSANAFTVGGHTIVNAVASVKPFLIRGASGQSVNLFEIQTSASSALVSVSSGGSLTVGGNINGLNIRCNGGDTSNGSGIFALLNAATVPTTTPAAGGIIYVQAGALKYIGSSGTVTTLAIA
jgi:hypothetical protein